jgi:4-amino-4-deoxychorismate lyase
MDIVVNCKPEVVEYRAQECKELFETIKIKDGKVFNLSYHQARVDKAYKEFFNKTSQLNLQDILHPPKVGLFRAKVVYSADGLVDCNFYSYKKKRIKNIMLIENSAFEYRYKFKNRDFFEHLYNIYRNIDEFIITKNGYLQDFTIGNIALLSKDDNSWHTPNEPLLFGTTLQRYLESKKLKMQKLHYTNLKNYSKIALLNAMVDFEIL